MPERDDDRQVGLGALEGVGRLDCQPRRFADKADVLGSDDTKCDLGPTLLADAPP